MTRNGLDTRVQANYFPTMPVVGPGLGLHLFGKLHSRLAQTTRRGGEVLIYNSDRS